MKLALGTVQFGLAYGAFNADGAVARNEVAACLDAAATAGVDTLDTASAYGTSEAVLGRLGAGERFRVVTKAPPEIAAANLADAVARSLDALRIDRVHALMLHRAEPLLGGEGPALWRALEAVRDGGFAGKIGISVYTPAEALTLIERFPLQIVQAPFSAFDQRMRTSGAFDALAERGVEIHARSVFLQGFALAEPGALPPHLAAYRDALARFRRLAAEHGVTPLRLALAAAEREPAIDRIVVGVQSRANLTEIIAAAADPPPTADLAACAVDDPRLINPALWRVAA